MAKLKDYCLVVRLDPEKITFFEEKLPRGGYCESVNDSLTPPRRVYRFNEGLNEDNIAALSARLAYCGAESFGFVDEKHLDDFLR